MIVEKDKFGHLITEKLPISPKDKKTSQQRSWGSGGWGVGGVSESHQKAVKKTHVVF